MQPLPRARFEALVVDALDLLAEELVELIDNVVITVADRHHEEPELLGLYEGIPLTDRHDYGALMLPDRITIYRLACCDICADEDELVWEVAVTVVHEIAHHFGIEDDRLEELGWA